MILYLHWQLRRSLRKGSDPHSGSVHLQPESHDALPSRNGAMLWTLLQRVRFVCLFSSVQIREKDNAELPSPWHGGSKFADRTSHCLVYFESVCLRFLSNRYNGSCARGSLSLLSYQFFVCVMTCPHAVTLGRFTSPLGRAPQGKCWISTIGHYALNASVGTITSNGRTAIAIRYLANSRLGFLVSYISFLFCFLLQ